MTINYGLKFIWNLRSVKEIANLANIEYNLHDILDNIAKFERLILISISGGLESPEDSSDSSSGYFECRTHVTQKILYRSSH
jgi:hypothetical protein